MGTTYGEPAIWRAGGRTIRRRTPDGRLRKWNVQHAAQRARMLRRTMLPRAANNPRVRQRMWGHAIITRRWERELATGAAVAGFTGGLLGLDDLSRAIGDYREAQRQQVLAEFAGVDVARDPDRTGIFGGGGGRRGH